MLKFIEPLYFFLSLFVGLFFVYISTPTPEIVFKYPMPENADKLVYQDDADTCYKYIVSEIKCPSDKSKIKEFKLQHIDNQTKNDKGLFEVVKEKVGL